MDKKNHTGRKTEKGLNRDSEYVLCCDPLRASADFAVGKRFEMFFFFCEMRAKNLVFSVFGITAANSFPYLHLPFTQLPAPNFKKKR